MEDITIVDLCIGVLNFITLIVLFIRKKPFLESAIFFLCIVFILVGIREITRRSLNIMKARELEREKENGVAMNE